MELELALKGTRVSADGRGSVMVSPIGGKYESVQQRRWCVPGTMLRGTGDHGHIGARKNEPGRMDWGHVDFVLNIDLF